MPFKKFGGGYLEKETLKKKCTLSSRILSKKYLTFTDAEKCFDKLWLEDGINELWRLGTNVRDCIMIKRMNEVARIVVKTPLGPTRQITVRKIVKQGTVYGPQICISSMDKINLLGRDVVTYYGPNIPIQAVSFVDDVTGVGSIILILILIL